MQTKQLLRTQIILSACHTTRPATTVFSQRAVQHSTTVAAQQDAATKSHDDVQVAPVKLMSAGLERLPTMSLMRNLVLGIFFISPTLFRLGFRVLETVADSRSVLLNPDRNPLLRALFKPFVYDQFCAGTNKSEIFHTRDSIKSMGYSGVVLCYGKEIQISQSQELRSTGASTAGEAEEIEQWRAGNIETLDMVGTGDWLGIKLTGAGHAVTEALMSGAEPPAQFLEAMDSICQKAREQDCRIWIDAEQQVLQKTIDQWVIAMMRRYNTHGKALVYNTLQAYLKASKDKLRHQIQVSSQEGWTLAIKLVRGAYIANDQREKIHDNKQNTDDSYNGIVASLLSGEAQKGAGHPSAKMQLLLAGHNPESIRRAFELISKHSEQGSLKVVPEFGQLQGMADNIGCEFLERCEALKKSTSPAPVPRIYKCLTWGSIQECMQYLLRRLVENQSGADRMRDGIPLYYAELKRRMFRRQTA